MTNVIPFEKTMENPWITYKIINKINGMIYYGKTNLARWKDTDEPYYGSGILLKKDLRLFGTISFDRQILGYFETEAEAYAHESELIKTINKYNPMVYNQQMGHGKGANHKDRKKKPRIKKIVSNKKPSKYIDRYKPPSFYKEFFYSMFDEYYPIYKSHHRYRSCHAKLSHYCYRIGDKKVLVRKGEWRKHIKYLIHNICSDETSPHYNCYYDFKSYWQELNNIRYINKDRTLYYDLNNMYSMSIWYIMNDPDNELLDQFLQHYAECNKIYKSDMVHVYRKMNYRQNQSSESEIRKFIKGNDILKDSYIKIGNNEFMRGWFCYN